MTKIQKNDFIEIEFTGRDVSNNQIFDTTDSKEAEGIGFQDPEQVKPLVISVGNQMILQGLDDDLEGKELNKEYKLHLEPEKAFGKRNPQLIKTYSINNFKKNNIDPYPGMALQLDNQVVKVISVSGGRVTVDFNNPLAGKEIDYTFKITKKITDDSEKINSLQDYFFKQRFEFTINKEKKKVTFKEQTVKPFIEMIGEKFKQITGFEFEVEEEKKEEKPKDNSEGNKEDREPNKAEEPERDVVSDTNKK